MLFHTAVESRLPVYACLVKRMVLLCRWIAVHPWLSKVFCLIRSLQSKSSMQGLKVCVAVCKTQISLHQAPFSMQHSTL